MSEYQNDRLLRALHRKPVDRVPVWMMRQAGRYLPEYRAVRRRADFMTMLSTPELAAQVTLQPVDRLGVDAAIVFSDILVVPRAMGMELRIDSGQGPRLLEPIRAPEELRRLRSVIIERDLGYVLEAVRQATVALARRVPLIGFAGAPWTLMAYMVEGEGSKSFAVARRFLHAYPEAARQLLDRLAAVVGEFLLAQAEAGAAVVQVFESWAGLLGPEDYRRWALPALERVLEILRGRVPVIVFAKDGGHVLEPLAELQPHGLSLDWTIDPTGARERLGHRVVLQGNLDPAVLYADPAYIQERTWRMVRAFGVQGYIANLGHGILPDTPPEHAQAFVEAVHGFPVSEFAPVSP
jgi:uroporphyrinogen decarboxylase|nr:MAG: uroporphyrinogen decarboxylase [Bacteroidota bacterium]